MYNELMQNFRTLCTHISSFLRSFFPSVFPLACFLVCFVCACSWDTWVARASVAGSIFNIVEFEEEHMLE